MSSAMPNRRKASLRKEAKSPSPPLRSTRLHATSSSTASQHRPTVSRTARKRRLDEDVTPDPVFSNAQSNQDQRSVACNPLMEKIPIGIDFGTENSAVAYKLQWKGERRQPQPGRDEILKKVSFVRFGDCSYVKTQIGWHSETYQMLYGHEVDDAIERGQLLRGSHIRGLKLSLLDPQTGEDKNRLAQQIRSLPQGARFVGGKPSLRRSRRKFSSEIQITPEDLVSEFIGYLVRHSLHQMATTESEGLHWPRWDPQTRFKDLEPAITSKVILYIAVPSLATPEFVELIIAAASRAGFPNVVVAPEPACAQQHLLQKEFENSRDRIGNRYDGASIIVDVGGGTADLQTLSIVKHNPIEIGEEVRGDGGFSGGRYVNGLLREHIKEQIGNQMQWLISQLNYPDVDFTEDEVLDHLEARFEKIKQGFGERRESPNYEDLLLPGRPSRLNRPDRGLVGYSFRLSRNAMVDMFSKQAKKLIVLIDKQISSFQAQIQRIILVGGCSRSVFLRNYLVDHYKNDQAAGYRISVEAPESADPESTIASGVLLAGFDENFVSERFLRRSYGIVWERAVEQLRDPKTPCRAKYCPTDGVLMVRDMSKWLLKSGSKVKRHFSSALSDDYGTSESGRAWRIIPFERKHDRVKLTEQIIYSDHANEDDLWIKHGPNKIFEAGQIEILLSKEECRAFEIRPNIDGKEFYYIEYEVILHGDGMRMTYEFLIPRTGKFVDGGPGNDPIRRTCDLNLAPAIRFYTPPDAQT